MTRLGRGPVAARKGNTLVLHLTRARCALLLGWVGLFAAGCECENPSGARLTITAPTNGATLTLADDTQPEVEGLQITVAVSTENLSAGTAVDLFLDGAVASLGMVDTAGAVAFEGVTIPDGTHMLVAVTREGGIRSNEVVVVVTGACFAVSFVDPEPAGDAVRLTAADDTDGEACGTTFETTVVVATAAPNGSQAQLFVNSTPRASTTVVGGVARFTGVGLDNRGPSTPNTLRVVVTDPAGGACGANYPLPIYVQCEGPSCAFTRPDTERAFLNQSDDTSAAEGFQTDFEVGTDTGVTARLVIDADEAGALTQPFMGTRALFGNVSLTETVHRFVAECTDALGNRTRSGVAEWTVDITPCGVGVDSPIADQVFVEEDDVNPAVPGVQIAVDGTAGNDCRGLRVGLCGGIDAVAFGPVTVVWSDEATLATSARQELCAQTRDAAGNVSEERVTIRFAGDAPALEIASPAPNTRFNQSTDLTPGDTTCAQDASVYCDAPGEPVELYRADTGTLIGSAPCVADVAVPAPFTGRASFSAVALPNREDGMSYPLEARITSLRLPGSSAPVSIFADCNAPSLAITRPTCGQMLNPNTQDESATTPGFQYRTSVTNNDMNAPVTLTIQPVGGGAPTYMATLPTTGAAVAFPLATYGSGGELEVIATATDSAGNVGRSPACTVTVLDLPVVTFLEPTMGQVLGVLDDCSAPRAGMQVRVRADTDAAPGTPALVRVGARTVMTTVNSARRVNVCADADDGPMVTITVEVTDSRGTGSASVVVAIDTVPPTNVIGPLTTTVVDRRAGVVRFQWTAVADAGPGSPRLARYELRCAASPITTEMEWEDAREVPMTTVPGTPGTVEREDIDAFRPGETEHCVMRGADVGSNLTPIGASATVAIAFLLHNVDGATSTGLGDRVVAVGDLNGDMIDDVLTGGTSGTAYLWYGSASGFSSAPSVRFASSAAGFGTAVHGLGDINGDGRNDFAIAAPMASANQGRVFVFFGRPAASPFPAGCDVDLASCAPSLIFDRPAGLSALGFSMSSSDFDGDGVNDLVIGAPGVSSFVGEVYVVRGGSHLVAGTTFVLDPTSPMAPPGFVLRPPMDVAQFGTSVAGLGASVVGDARHELVIASPGLASFGDRAALVLAEGRPHMGTGLNVVTTGLTVFATDVRGRYTVAVPIGDVDGDGVVDVASYSPAGSSAGRNEVHLGGADGFSSTRFYLVQNDSPGDRTNDTFGFSWGAGRHAYLGTLGDLDRDTRADMLLGSRQVGDVLHGSLDLFYGRAGTANRQRSRATPSLVGMNGMRRVGYVGDVNGDGFSDAAIGEPAANGNAGRLIIVY